MMLNALGAVIETVIIVAPVLANGFFVAAEFALVKVRTSQLRPLEKNGGWRVKFALKATRHLDAALSATQLGVTLASLGLGWLGEPFVAARLEPLLARVGLVDPVAVESISFSVAFATITFLHIVFGELAPKSLAIQRATGVSLWVAAPLMGFYYTFYPFIWLLNGTANRFLRWLGLRSANGEDPGFSPEELEYVFSQTRHSRPTEALVNKLMLQSLRLRQTCAFQVLRPKEEVVAIRTDLPVQDNLRNAQRSGHSRFPVCRGSLDHIIGILVVREWLWQMQALGPETPFEPLVRPALFFELKTPLPEMIERFRTSRTHLAVVRDELKRVAGIVTLEDVLEEIVGDIRDELDIGRGPIYQRGADFVVVSAAFTMRELQAETGWAFEWLPRESIAAWISRHLGRVPEQGERLAVCGYDVTIIAASTDQLRKIRIRRATVAIERPA